MLQKFTNETEWKAARAKDITSTELAALFGLHPYKSTLQLWMEKAGLVDLEDIEDSDPVRWGRRLQLAVGMGICEDQGWEGFDLSLFYHHDVKRRTGASYDVMAVCSKLGRIDLEIKIAENFSEEQGWTKTEVPTMYEFQVQGQLHEAFKSGVPFDVGAIGALGRRQSSRIWFREYDKKLGAIIDEHSEKFWASIERNEPPAPDYMVDGPLLERLRKPIRIGDSINLTDNERAAELVELYCRIRDQRRVLVKNAELLKKEMGGIEAELLDMVGRNEYAKIGKHRISAKKIVVEDHIVYGHERRNFSISKPK